MSHLNTKPANRVKQILVELILNQNDLPWHLYCITWLIWGEIVILLKKTTVFRDNWGEGMNSRHWIVWQDYLEVYGLLRWPHPDIITSRSSMGRVPLTKPTVICDVSSAKVGRGVTGTSQHHSYTLGPLPSHISSNVLKFSLISCFTTFRVTILIHALGRGYLPRAQVFKPCALPGCIRVPQRSFRLTVAVLCLLSASLLHLHEP